MLICFDVSEQERCNIGVEIPGRNLPSCFGKVTGANFTIWHGSWSWWGAQCQRAWKLWLKLSCEYVLMSLNRRDEIIWLRYEEGIGNVGLENWKEQICDLAWIRIMMRIARCQRAWKSWLKLSSGMIERADLLFGTDQDHDEDCKTSKSTKILT